MTFKITHPFTDLTLAIRVKTPTLADGTSPSADELREAIIATLRGFAMDLPDGTQIEFVDAAPFKRDLSNGG